MARFAKDLAFEVLPGPLKEEEKKFPGPNLPLSRENEMFHIKRVAGVSVAIASALFFGSSTTAQNFKVFETYRHLFPYRVGADEASAEPNQDTPIESIEIGNAFVTNLIPSDSDFGPDDSRAEPFIGYQHTPYSIRDDSFSQAHSDEDHGALNKANDSGEESHDSRSTRHDSDPTKMEFAHTGARDNSTSIDNSKISPTRDRAIAYNNYHRNRIASLDPNHPLLPPSEQTLSTGLFHTCAITRRRGVDHDSCSGMRCGPVKCWGHDESGQSSPPPGVMFTQISAGGYFTCGLRIEGDVLCWGDIDKALKSRNHAVESISKKQGKEVQRQARRLEKSEYRDEMMKRRNMKDEQSTRSMYSPNGGRKYIQVSSGMKHVCAISRDLTVHCWGRNDFGESTAPSGMFVQISAGNSFTCGLHSNGGTECWGKNNVGQSAPPSDMYFQHISVGGDHACGILVEDNSIRCWGNNGRGQSEPQDGSFLQISLGIRTTCAISDDTNDPSIHCWGSRANDLLGQIIGYGNRAGDESNDFYHQISLGQDHACAISHTDKKDSASSHADPATLKCWWMAGSDFDAHRVPVGLEILG
ncbi:hypothetical protein HJC23_009070 [Cyclotella cryptica]|uniref:non-specific serine/threonine protein kinase n=1 Tax=Cyclotella cryptica TaxID=29204 RepID=A0ABD3QYT1_9STRA